ncbi:MAG: LysM peptidoglycan-binding domain-containing protein [bacterium]
MLNTFKFPIILFLLLCFIVGIGSIAYAQTESFPMDAEIEELDMDDIEMIELEIQDTETQNPEMSVTETQNPEIPVNEAQKPQIPGAELPSVYIVRKGDTLWDISKKFFLDPFDWPELWKLNSLVEDPHWIYPGQPIILPKPKKKEAKPAPFVFKPPKIETPVEEVKIKKEEELLVIKGEQPLTDTSTMDSCGYILSKNVYKKRRKSENWGKVIGSKSNKMNLSSFDIIYLNQGIKDNIYKDQIFTIFRTEKKVDHIHTHKHMGYLIKILGLATIVDVNKSTSIAMITKCFSEIHNDDQFMPYEKMPSPFRLTPTEKNIEGCIIESRDSKMYMSIYDIVYLDIGSADNIKPGNYFYTFTTQSLFDRKTAKKPDVIYNKTGKISILRTEEHTSTALITQSHAPMPLGMGVKFFE